MIPQSNIQLNPILRKHHNVAQSCSSSTMLIATFSKRNNLCYITYWRGLPQLRIPPVINAFETCYTYWQFQLKIPLRELYTYRNSCPHVVYLVYRSSATVYIYLFQMTSWSPSCWLHIITLFTEPLITLVVVRLSEPLLLIAVDIGDSWRNHQY